MELELVFRSLCWLPESRLPLTKTLAIVSVVLFAILQFAIPAAAQDTEKASIQDVESNKTETEQVKSNDAKSSEETGIESLPDWISKGSYTADDNSSFLVAQTTEPYVSELEADSAINQAIQNAIAAHFLKTFQSSTAQLHRSGIDFKKLDLLVPRTRIVLPFQSAELDERFGRQGCTYYRGYAQIHIGNDLLESIQTALRRQKVRRRLCVAGLLGAGLLGTLGVLFGYLRIDHATRGFYNRRLQTVTIVIIIAIVAAICFAYLSLSK